MSNINLFCDKFDSHVVLTSTDSHSTVTGPGGVEMKIYYEISEKFHLNPRVTLMLKPRPDHLRKRGFVKEDKLTFSFVQMIKVKLQKIIQRTRY